MSNNERDEEFIPSIESISSGKIFTPSKKFMYKSLTELWLGVFSVWLMATLGWLGISYLVTVVDEGSAIMAYWNYVYTWFPTVSLILAILFTVIVLPGSIILPVYIRSIEYSVTSESGEAMPEIFVKKGIINVTGKHVPFRTVTNISGRAGVFDRLFGIGNIEIETAGYSGTRQFGPEEKLEGLTFYEELRNFILQELRKYRGSYTTGTEIISKEEREVPKLEDSLQDEILITLGEIRDEMTPLREILEILRTKEKEDES